VIDTLTRKIGFRRVELIQNPLEGEKGTSFYFKVNNKRIFIGGSNWIPIDTVQARGTKERFRKWIELLVSPSSLFLPHFFRGWERV
jgi:beta-mannosidase